MFDIITEPLNICPANFEAQLKSRQLEYCQALADLATTTAFTAFPLSSSISMKAPHQDF